MHFLYKIVDVKSVFRNIFFIIHCPYTVRGLFSVGSGLKDNEREAGNVPQVGTVITFKYFELTKDGIPRFPTFLRIRPDVEATQFM